MLGPDELVAQARRFLTRAGEDPPEPLGEIVADHHRSFGRVVALYSARNFATTSVASGSMRQVRHCRIQVRAGYAHLERDQLANDFGNLGSTHPRVRDAEHG